MTSKLATKEFSSTKHQNEDFILKDEFVRQLYCSITKGLIGDSLDIYKEFQMEFDSDLFVDGVLIPTINKIENDFVGKKINKATYHVANNISKTFVKIISETANKN